MSGGWYPCCCDTPIRGSAVDVDYPGGGCCVDCQAEIDNLLVWIPEGRFAPGGSAAFPCDECDALNGAWYILNRLAPSVGSPECRWFYQESRCVGQTQEMLVTIQAWLENVPPCSFFLRITIGSAPGGSDVTWRIGGGSPNLPCDRQTMLTPFTGAGSYPNAVCRPIDPWASDNELVVEPF